MRNFLRHSIQIMKASDVGATNRRARESACPSDCPSLFASAKALTLLGTDRTLVAPSFPLAPAKEANVGCVVDVADCVFVAAELIVPRVAFKVGLPVAFQSPTVEAKKYLPVLYELSEE